MTSFQSISEFLSAVHRLFQSNFQQIILVNDTSKLWKPSVENVILMQETHISLAKMAAHFCQTICIHIIEQVRPEDMGHDTVKPSLLQWTVRSLSLTYAIIKRAHQTSDLHYCSTTLVEPNQATVVMSGKENLANVNKTYGHYPVHDLLTPPRQLQQRVKNFIHSSCSPKRPSVKASLRQFSARLKDFHANMMSFWFTTLCLKN